MTTATAETMTPDAIADNLRELLRRFHRESCYPNAYDFEINEYVNEILFLMHSVNWQVVISAADARL
jgi:hypothetical protein